MACQFGLTGGIGSGKSFVAGIFSKMGIPVYISDIRAKKLYLDPEIKKAVLELFGDGAYVDNSLNTKFISDKIFNNKTLLQSINDIIHPAVALDFNHWMEKHKEKPYILKESAILIENNLHQSLDGLISVMAPAELRIKRTMTRDNRSRNEVIKRMQNQTNDEIRIKESNYLIFNCPSHNLLRQIQLIHNKLILKHTR